MTISRARHILLCSGLLAVFYAAPVFAQQPDTGNGGREASFLPPPDSAPPAIAPALPEPVTVPALAPVPAAAAPAPATPSPAVITPAISPVVTPLAVAPAPANPVDLGKPVEAGTLEDIHPESIGLLAQADGGLGAAMWKGTPRALLERLLPALNLPVPSPTLNNLAQRFLLTAASIPAGDAAAGQSLTAMRVEKLVMLGDARDAWKLAMLAKPEQIDEITLRLTAEAALLSDAKDDVCLKLPDIMKNHSSAEWQKLLLVCQLRAKDTKAAQLTLDLLHAEKIDDESYMDLAEKNILAGGKQLPRRLTPLKPLTLALLQMVDAPLPGEIYAHPDAALIPVLLQAKAREDNARLTLAERAAERGLIASAELESVYANTALPPDALAAPDTSKETGPRLHALLYQAALRQQDAQKRIDLAAQFIANATPALLNGAAAQVLVDMVGAQETGQNYPYAITMLRIDLTAGKGDNALEWLKLAKRGAIGMPGIAADLQSIWPLLVFGGLESDKDYAADCAKWLDAMLKEPDAKTPDAKPVDMRAQRQQAAAILLLLDATGFAVPDDGWARVVDAPVFEKHPAPGALLPERLRAAGIGNRRGEAVLIGLLLAGGDQSLANAIETIRALRLTGLTADAAMLARETASAILMPAPPARP